MDDSRSSTELSLCVCRFVTDATVALFVAVLLFVLPSEPPRYLCFWRRSDTGTTKTQHVDETQRQFLFVIQMVLFDPIRVSGLSRPRPFSAHLAGDSEEDALEYRPAAGRRLCFGQRQ